MSPQQAATFIHEQIPAGGLFAGLEWKISPAPFPLGAHLAQEIESLGRVLLQFYRATNLLYRKSVEGKQPEWVARWLDLGKPAELIALQRAPAFKNDVPRVIRPDILLTENGFSITELDSVPGGIGLTGWLGQTYSAVGQASRLSQTSKTENGDGRDVRPTVIGGADGMLRGFESIFGDAKQVHIVVSEEAATYKPEMIWLSEQLGARFVVRDSNFLDFKPGDAIYRFFELFDLANVPNAQKILELTRHSQILVSENENPEAVKTFMAHTAQIGNPDNKKSFHLNVLKRIRLTPPPKPMFEEKMLFALLWNRNLQNFWRQELGEGFLARLKKIIPYTWLVDPTPLPPHAAIPELNLTDWQQLKTMSQRERDLVLKVSGFSENAWGARGVFLGSDLSQADWSAAVDAALKNFEKSPSVLQRFHKPALVDASWFDFAKNEVVPMKGRVRLCPYYFVSGEGDNLRSALGVGLATIVPADKKSFPGMTDAILANCSV